MANLIPSPASPSPILWDSQKSHIDIYCYKWAKDGLCVLAPRLFISLQAKPISLKAHRCQTQIFKHPFLKKSKISRFFSHLEPVCFAHPRNLTQHLLTIDEVELVIMRSQGDLLSSLTQQFSTLWMSDRCHLWPSLSYVPSLSLPKALDSLMLWWNSPLTKHSPNKACTLMFLMVIFLWCVPKSLEPLRWLHL